MTALSWAPRCRSCQDASILLAPLLQAQRVFKARLPEFILWGSSGSAVAAQSAALRTAFQTAAAHSVPSASLKIVGGPWAGRCALSAISARC